MKLTKTAITAIAVLFICAVPLLWSVTTVSAETPPPPTTLPPSTTPLDPPLSQGLYPVHPFPPGPPVPPFPYVHPTPPDYTHWHFPWPDNSAPYWWRLSQNIWPHIIVIEQPRREIVYAAPVISSFTANPGYVNANQQVVLIWSVNNTDTVTISPDIGTVANSGSYTLTPLNTTTYTLTAVNSGGSVSASTTVAVNPVYSSTSYSSTAVTTTAVASSTDYSNLATMGIGDTQIPFNSWPVYAGAIVLLAIAAGAITVLARKPAVAYAGHRSGTTVYRTWDGQARLATEIPKTSSVGVGNGAGFITSGGEAIPIGNNRSLGRDQFRSYVSPSKAGLISREHLRVNIEQGEYYIEDRNSTNGTKVNGIDISGKGRYQVKNGDLIDLADALSFTFKAS